jgi:hypothetical protein
MAAVKAVKAAAAIAMKAVVAAAALAIVAVTMEKGRGGGDGSAARQW